MELISLQKKVNEVIAKRGRPEKAYFGNFPMFMFLNPLVTVEAIFNESRYIGKVVLRYGNEMVEVLPDEKPKPTPAYNPKPQRK